MKAKLIGKGFVTRIARKDESIMLIGINGKEEFDIGRSKEADCCIIDTNISRKHAKLKFDHGTMKWAIIDNKSANGVLLNDRSVNPLIPTFINNGDIISIPTENETYIWIYDCETELCDVDNRKTKYILDKNSIYRSKVERSKSISHHIGDSQQFQVERVLKEKQELDRKVKDSELLRETLAKEKNELTETLNRDRNKFIEAQEKEREEFEQRLVKCKNETIENQRREFEERLKSEKEAMETKQKEAEATLAKKSEEAEYRIEEALKERDIMMAKMEEEKARAEEILEIERKKYEKEVETLQIAFKHEKENVTEYKEALEKINAEFQEKLNSGKKEFEATIAKEKSDKELERLEKEKMRNELLSRQEEISELKEQLNRKRKSDEELQERDSKRARAEEKARFLDKCNDELKCSICDDIFIEPMSLNCGHVYCQYCLERWKKDCKKNNKPYTCPNCRSKITNSVRSIHLDNLIAAIFRDANDEVKKDREELIKDRQEEESTFFKQPKQKKTQVQKSTSTVRNYFQPSNPPTRPVPPGQSENGAILATSTTRTQGNIDTNSHPYNNLHSSANNDDANVNLLPLILPNLSSGSTSNIDEHTGPTTRNRNRSTVISAVRSSPRIARTSTTFSRRATLSNGEVVRIRIIPPGRGENNYQRVLDLVELD